jgi:hypothetical protein
MKTHSTAQQFNTGYPPEDAICNKLLAVGWRIVDREQPFTRADAEQCHFWRAGDLIVPMDRRAHRAFVQTLNDRPIDAPPEYWRPNELAEEVREFFEKNETRDNVAQLPRK